MCSRYLIFCDAVCVKFVGCNLEDSHRRHVNCLFASISYIVFNYVCGFEVLTAVFDGYFLLGYDGWSLGIWEAFTQWCSFLSQENEILSVFLIYLHTILHICNSGSLLIIIMNVKESFQTAATLFSILHKMLRNKISYFSVI